MHREIPAGELQPGDIVDLAIGPQTVSHITTHPAFPVESTRSFVDVHLVGIGYALCYREDIEVAVLGTVTTEGPTP